MTTSANRRSILIVSWAGGGNLNPVLGLAEELIANDHTVTALGSAPLGSRFREAGMTVLAPPEGWLPSAEHVLQAIEEAQPDAVVVDYMLTAALCGAKASGLATAALVHTLYTSILDDGAPNPIAMSGSVSDVNDVRARVGLPPIERFGDLLSETDQVLVTVPAELDDEGGADLPANVSYVGALGESAGPDAAWEPPEGDGPLIVVSLGTAGDPALQLPLLQKTLEAVEPLPVRVLVTVPAYLSELDLEPTKNVTLTDYVRHAAVLPHADLMVTHGGMGSVGAALAHGLAMVCVPLEREQPDNARAVVRLGAGVAVERNEPAEVLRRAIEEALGSTERIRLAPDPQRAVELATAMVQDSEPSSD